MSWQVMNPASTPYVSAVSMTNVTVSAPPHVLGKFLAASKLQSRTLPIESPYHAPHLFSDSTKDIAVKDFHDPSLSSYELQIPLLSPAGGHISASNFEEALQEVVSQTLRCQVRWDKVIESCRELLQQTQTNICEIVPVLSNAYQLLSTHISQNSGIKTNVNDAMKTGSIPRPSKPTGKFEQSKIAVTGFSGRYPDAASNEEFWLLLQEGRDVHRTVPEDRFDWKAHYDPTGKARNTSRVQYGCFIREPGLFDTHFFHMSPREAASTDPAQRLLIMSTYEALEMAGFVPNRTPSTQVDRVGVFMGTTSDDWREVNSGQDVDTYFIPGGNRAFIPGRINYFFKFSGPSLSIDTACSSSFSAIHTACNYLWKGDCDTAVAGGTNILTNPDNFAGLDRGHFLSTTGNCNTFDDGANGYCRADAIGSVILKRYEDAIADNDPIFGAIIGAHTNHCGQAESITRPHEGDQASVFNRILRYSNQNPLDVSYVEMHGTGTQAGDATEMNSVLSCFVPEKQRMPHYPLHLGSVKANIGHAESASGVSSLIKVLLMMKNNQIPPHCGIKTKINHNYPLDLKDRNVHIASRSTEWNRRGCVNGKRMAFLNNFSAAGGNTALFLEDGPVRKSVEQQGNLRKMYPVAITAKSAKALECNARAMLAYLKSNPDISPASLSYTTTARRMQHNFRTMVSGVDVKSIQNNLQKKLPDMPAKPIPSPALIPKVAFVFTGQGALYAGVGRELYESEASFRNDILRFDTIAQQQGFPSILPLVDGSVSEEQEAQPMIAHVGHTCIQMALCNLWSTWNISPSLVIGHSLGEYAAFYASGITTAADTIYLVGTRARLLSDSCSQGSHSMVSVKAPQSEVAGETRRSSCEIACVNQPDGTVLSGPRQEIDHVTGKLEGLAKKCVKLYLPYAFHSAQIEPILEDFEKLASSVHFSKPSIPFLSPLLGSVIDEGSTLNAAYLTKACRHTVNFEAALEAAKESGTVTDKTIWLELGPHPLCSGMIKSTLGSQITTLPSLEKRMDAWTSIVGALENLYTRGIEIDWNAYQRQVVCSHEVLELPRYSWDLKNYWIPYRNNFCLTKGDIPEPQAAARKGLEAEPASIITPSVQRIVEFDRDTSSIVIESDINHLALTGVLQGHKVNGVALCPSSLYADMAMTIVNQIFKMKDMPTDSVRLDVSDMKVGKPLVANGSTLLRVSASIDWNVRIALLSYYGVSSNGKKLADHATCRARISDGTSWTEEWSRLSFLINHRVCALQDSVNAGTAHKMKRGIVYKLFSSLVEYSEGYRGMEEVILDSGELEATAKINFQAGDEGFHLNPQWIDSLGHIAGFVMNANDSVASKDTVFVNHGWDGMKIWTKLSNNKTYRTYNKMELTTNNLYVGNTYILEGSQIVAVFSGVKVSNSASYAVLWPTDIR